MKAFLSIFLTESLCVLSCSGSSLPSPPPYIYRASSGPRSSMGSIGCVRSACLRSLCFPSLPPGMRQAVGMGGGQGRAVSRASCPWPGGQRGVPGLGATGCLVRSVGDWDTRRFGEGHAIRAGLHICCLVWGLSEAGVSLHETSLSGTEVSFLY